MKKILTPVLFSLLGLLMPIANAADYAFDKVHTQILFSVSHLGFSTSTGAFVEFDGDFSFDPAKAEEAKVSVVIQTASIDMNNEKWSSHLRGAKWFDVENHPTMGFTSTSVTKTGENTMDVVGDLTIKGVTKSVTLNTKLNKMGEFRGKERIGFDATATIDRSEFGVSNALPAIPAEVLLRITVEGVKS